MEERLYKKILGKNKELSRQSLIKGLYCMDAIRVNENTRVNQVSSRTQLVRSDSNLIDFFIGDKMKWKPIKGFEELYDVSDQGSIRTYYKQVRGRQVVFIKPQMIMKTQQDTNGYPTIGLRRRGLHFSRRIHRLVLETFISDCPEGMECCHKNNIKNDNRLCNLHWDTHRNNQVRDGGARGIIKRGSDNPATKIDNYHIILAIRELAEEGWTHKSIAVIFGLKRRHVTKIINKKIWSYV